jgi:hypothetical protein
VLAGCASPAEDAGTSHVAAAAAATSTPFIDVTIECGAYHEVLYPPISELNPLFSHNLGLGAAAEDLDGDGHIDLYVGNAVGPKSLFWNEGGGRFAEGAAAAGAALPEDWTCAVGAADLDNDGDQDLYLVNFKEDRILMNRGDRTFESVSLGPGLDFPNPGLGVQFGDLDLDGVLDMFIAETMVLEPVTIEDENETPTWPLSQSHLLKGLGGGRFEDVTSRVPLPLGNPFVGAIIDLDADGDQDLYVLQDTYGRVYNLLLENRGPDGKGFVNLVDVSETCGCQLPQGPMGLGVVDIDSNGLPDLFVSNLYTSPPTREVLLLNRGALVFQDISEPTNAYSMDAWGDFVRSASWGVNSLDVNNDTLEDIFVVYGGLIGASGKLNTDRKDIPNQEDALLINHGSSFEVAVNSGLEDPGRAHAAVVADFDEDGCEDVYVVNLDEPARLYRSRCDSGAHWVVLKLVGTKSNRDAIGARVRVTTGPRVQWRQVLGCSTSVHSCNPKQLHLGLGAATRIDDVTIYWPSGVVQTVAGLGVDRRHVIVEPAK